MKRVIVLLMLVNSAIAQNMGIGTNNPEAKLHVNGDLKLQYGTAINKFSRDSAFSENSHFNIPTEKAIKDFIQKGIWTGANLSSPGPQAPVARSFSVLDADNANALATKGTLAFVLSSNFNKLSIVDFSNPDALVRKASIITNLDLPTSVFVQGNYAYVSSALNSRLCIFDISNPDMIVARGFTNMGLAFPRSVVVQGNYAYVASDDIGRISIFDISNPDNIIARGTGGLGLTAPISLAIQGNYLYATSYSASELQIYDIGNPNSVVYKTFINTNLSGARALDVSGNYAYVASQNNNRLCVFDISNPNSIVAKGSIFTNLSLPNSVKVMGNYAFVSSEGNDQICMFDISNPSVILAKGNSSANLSQPMSVALSGNYICVANQGNNRNLCIYDLDYSKSLQLSAEGITAVSDTWKSEGINIFRTNGFVGIRKQYPSQALDVNGNIASSGGISSNTVSTTSITTTSINTSIMGIGISNPSTPLSFPASLGKKISLYPGGTGDVGMAVEGNDFRLYTDNAGAKVSIGYSQYAANFYQNNLDVYANGNAWLRGTLTQNSDIRLKRNIIPLDNSLNLLTQLNGYHYYWKNTTNEQSMQTGLIAQEVQKLFPELVKENEKGELSVNYTGMIPVLIESVKQLKQQAEDRIQKQEKQEQQIQELRDQLQQLIKRLEDRKSIQ